MTKIFILQLKLLIESIVQMDKIIRNNYRAPSDSVIFDSLPNAASISALASNALSCMAGTLYFI
jgi:hypothetical protein